MRLIPCKYIIKMRILTSDKWNKFKINLPNANRVKRDGNKFEDLVKKLLDEIYPNHVWTATKKTWDGSKDFFSNFNDKLKWAECKNYTKRLRFNVLSPTLVMAQLAKVNELLIFSYSEIDKFAKKKIIASADANDYSVYFYDDEILEDVILKHFDKLGDFFENIDLKSVKNHLNRFNEIELDYNLYYGNSFSSIYNEAHTRFPNNLDLFSLIQMDVIIINRQRKAAKGTLKFDSEDTDANIYNFEVSPNAIKDSGIEINLKAFESKIVHIFLTPAVYRPVLRVPNIIFSYNKKNELIKFNSFNCKFKRRSYLIGEKYKTIYNDFKEQCLSDRKEFACFAISGSSGTGKSRLISECRHFARKSGYVILDYVLLNESTSASFSYVLKQMILSIFKIEDEAALFELGNKEYQLLGMIEDLKFVTTEAESRAYIDKHMEAIFDKLSSQKFCLVIDNLQNFDNSILYFLEKIINFAKNTRNACLLKIIYSINTDLIRGNFEIYNIFSESKCDNLFNYIVRGFENDKDVENFFRQLFSFKSTDSLPWAKQLYKKTKGNPYYIDEIVKTLLGENYNNYIGKNDILSLNIYQTLNMLPESAEKNIGYRWQKFVEEHPEVDKYLLTFSAIYFYGSLSENDLSTFKLNRKIIMELCTRGFVSNDNNVFTFCHDLIKLYMVKNYYKYLADTDDCNGLETLFIFHIIENHLVDYFDPIRASIILRNTQSSYPEKEITQIRQKSILLSGDIAAIFFRNVLCDAIAHRKLCANYQKWTEDIYYICLQYREILGNKEVLKEYSKILNIIKNSEIYETLIPADIIHQYCEVLHENGLASLGAKILEEYIAKVEAKKELIKTNEDKIKLAFTYNRLYVNFRKCAADPRTSEKAKYALKRARELIVGTNCPYFPNDSDEGYMYYCEESDRDKLLYFWNSDLKSYTANDKISIEYTIDLLNLYRKRVQIALIKKDYKSAKQNCEYALECINKASKYENHRQYFHRWFTLAKAENLIIENAARYSASINECLLNADEIDFFMGFPQNYDILVLKGAISFYEKNYMAACNFMKEAFIVLASQGDVSYKKFIMHQIIHNILITIKIGKLDLIREYFNFIGDEDETDKVYTYVKKPSKYELKATSVISTKDGLLNLPCL